MHVSAVLRPAGGGTSNSSGEAAKSLDCRGSKRRSRTLTAYTTSPATVELLVQIPDISQGGIS
jgi:hypothetical protein